MAREPFDIERIRKNWDRAVTPAAEAPSRHLAKAARPVDLYSEARALLGRARALARVEAPSQMEVLNLFFDRAEELIAAIEPARLASDEPDHAAPMPSAKEARVELQAALNDIEDLLEIYSSAFAR